MITEPFGKHAFFTVTNCADFTIDPITGLNIFRIFQEAVHNSLKHSEATELIAKIECSEDSFLVTISDNGKGITTKNEEGSGLASMRQRAEAVQGVLSIETAAGKGTQVVVKINKNTLNG